MAAISFESTLAQFVDDLKGTFPEFSDALAHAAALPDIKDRFVGTWRAHTADVAAQDASIFDVAGGIEIVPGVVMTLRLWNELSDSTHAAIWKYISSLLLLAAASSTKDDTGSLWDLSGFNADMETMMKMLSGGGGGGTDGGEDSADTTGLGGDSMKDIFAKLSSMAAMFGGLGGIGSAAAGAGAGAGLKPEDLSGAGAKFKIPDRLFRGHIARIAEELVKEFKPEDFGISPDMLESDDPARVFNYLQEVFTKKPELMMSAAQKIARKIQGKFQRGEIKRDEIIREAEELMKEFSENTAFSELFGSLGEMLKGSEKESGNEGSTRRREVQERLRRKAAEKAVQKAAAAAGGAGAGSANVIVHDHEAERRAAAAAASLLLEEDTAIAKRGAAKGGNSRGGKK
jgi:hypothetical protein